MSAWKQGQVAMVECDCDEWHLALYDKRENAYANWRFADGTLRDAGLSKARRVAVIDFENREQIDRLEKLYDAALSNGKPFESPEDCLQAALREFAKPTPPKPEEPTGLRAAVEDRRGRTWVRIGDPVCPWVWYDPDVSEFLEMDYRDLDATEVLSEGVPS